MSYRKVVRLSLIGVSIFAALYVLLGTFMGPGVSDISIRIAAGYMYDDAGGYEKMISYMGDERPNEIIVDSRVDGYKLIGSKLYVARRPVVSELAKDGALDSRLLPYCEYWIINVETGYVERKQTEKLKEAPKVRCELI